MKKIIPKEVEFTCQIQENYLIQRKRITEMTK